MGSMQEEKVVDIDQDEDEDDKVEKGKSLSRRDDALKGHGE